MSLSNHQGGGEIPQQMNEIPQQMNEIPKAGSKAGREFWASFAEKDAESVKTCISQKGMSMIYLDETILP